MLGMYKNICLVRHDPESCPTVWARWCEWRFWQQGMCSGVDQADFPVSIEDQLLDTS